MACGKLIASARHTLALTGTIIGGYANHLFPLMIRLNPKTLRDEGFEWGKDWRSPRPTAGSTGSSPPRRTTPADPPCGSNVKSMRRARSGKSTERKAVRPGVMPTMFGRHMIGSSMFITLGETGVGVARPVRVRRRAVPVPTGGRPTATPEPRRAWVDVACDMAPGQKAEYDRVTATLEFANKELLRRGSMKLLGAYLWTAMDYPDRPWGWGHDKEVLKAFEHAQAEIAAEKGQDEATRLKLGHTVGYWDQPGVAHPRQLRRGRHPQVASTSRSSTPRNRRLIDICTRQKAEGMQTWVYVQMTGKRNIQPRLKALLEREGLRVGILRSGDVDPDRA